MTSLSEVRAEIGEQASRPRYVDDEDVEDLETISDPTSWRDETKQTLSQSASNHPLLFAFGMVLTAVVTLFFLWVLGRFGFNLIQNTLAQVVIGATFLASSAYLFGRRTQRSAFTELDWLVLVTSDGASQYLGHYVEDEYGDPVFVPTRGFTKLGHQGNVYTVDQFAPDLARKLDSIHGRSGEEPAKIRLQPGLAQVDRTDFGVIVGQLAGGLELDPFGQSSNLQTTVPDQADESALTDLEEELHSARKEVQHREKRLTDMEIRLNKLRQDLREDREETIGEFVDRVTKISAAFDRRRTQQTDDGEMVHRQPDQQRLEDIEEELSDED